MRADDIVGRYLEGETLDRIARRLGKTLPEIRAILHLQVKEQGREAAQNAAGTKLRRFRRDQTGPAGKCAVCWGPMPQGGARSRRCSRECRADYRVAKYHLGQAWHMVGLWGGRRVLSARVRQVLDRIEAKRAANGTAVS